MGKPPHGVPEKGTNRRKAGLDRRSGDDRRRIYSLEYFSEGGVERRFDSDRRDRAERRRGWTRTDQWSSYPTDHDDDDRA